MTDVELGSVVFADLGSIEIHRVYALHIQREGFAVAMTLDGGCVRTGPGGDEPISAEEFVAGLRIWARSLTLTTQGDSA